ncbi:hypothetical protein HZH66_012945 [Vespula vulgaris]|uniref:Uncharacterized protein n=1 Tax=Vespula vulgaris TaxID=7454 RepID=A0A834MSH0_VESVU|nr:hypothetical protein HZH66_012945 [Vespula vulgaris]
MKVRLLLKQALVEEIDSLNPTQTTVEECENSGNSSISISISISINNNNSSSDSDRTISTYSRLYDLIRFLQRKENEKENYELTTTMTTTTTTTTTTTMTTTTTTTTTTTMVNTVGAKLERIRSQFSNCSVELNFTV